jgi:hypothetical protein
MSEPEQPDLYEPDGNGHTVQIVQVCMGHREVTFRRSQSPAEAPNYGSASEAVPQASLAGQVRPCAFSLPTHPTQGEATGPQPIRARDSCGPGRSIMLLALCR